MATDERFMADILGEVKLDGLIQLLRGFTNNQHADVFSFFSRVAANLGRLAGKITMEIYK